MERPVDKVEVIQGDIRDLGVVDRALEGIDVVVHAALQAALAELGGALHQGHH